MQAGKRWGETESIFRNDNFEVHRISIKKGGVCSKHVHRYKHNLFYVEHGELIIRVWKNDYALIDETLLTDRQVTDVQPNEWHQFEAREDTVAYEIYFSEPIGNDIIREAIGIKGGNIDI